MDKVTQVNIEGHNYGFVAGQAVKGSCASAAADWVKTIVLPEGVTLVEGMVVATLFLNTNSAGFSDSITIYSSSGNVYYYDPEMTEVVDLPPYEDCYVITHIEGTAYKYEAYPVAVINGVRVPICDSRGKPCGGPIWSGGDTIASLYLDDKLLMLHSTTINTLQEGSTLPVTSGAVKTAYDALSDRCDGLEPISSIVSGETKAPTSGAVAEAFQDGMCVGCFCIDKETRTISGSEDSVVLGAYGTRLFSIPIPVPTGWHKEYVLAAQLSTGDSGYIRVRLNNIATNWVGTCSTTTFRGVGCSARFKESDIVLETTLGYSQQGTNLHIQGNGGNGYMYCYGVYVICFLVKN